MKIDKQGPDIEVVQYAYTVDDIYSAMRDYVNQLGIGPWFVFENFSFETLVHRGRPSGLSITLALASSNGAIIELIQQTCDSPSVYKEVVDKRGHGFHHWGIIAQQGKYDSQIEIYNQHGYPTAVEAKLGIGGRAAYVDSTRTLGAMIEVIEDTIAIRELFSAISSATHDWDGTDPVRRFTPSGGSVIPD